MKTRISVGSAALVVLVGALALVLPASGGEEPGKPMPSTSVAPPERTSKGWDAIPLPAAAQRGVKWLVLGQADDGGWNANGTLPGSPKMRATSGWWSKRTDVGNTSLAALAILGTGSTPATGTFQGPLERAVEYVLQRVERSQRTGLQLGSTSRAPQPTQLQGKIGRYADTFLAARFLAEVDGRMHDKRLNLRVRLALERLVDKIEKGQSGDGSWNQSGGWAPIHSTAYASQALWRAKERGVDVDERVLLAVNEFTARRLKGSSSRAPSSATPSRLRDSPRRGPPVKRPGGVPTPVTPAPAPLTVGAAGVALYSLGQGIEQLSRTPADRKRYARELAHMMEQVARAEILKGLGSIGGEELISYNNINLAMARMGGREAMYWNLKMKGRLEKIQNPDGSWSGHHCITGRTACTAAAVLTILSERTVPRRD